MTVSARSPTAEALSLPGFSERCGGSNPSVPTPSCKNDGTIPCAVSSTLRLEGEACDAKLCERCAETAHGLCESCLLIERTEAHCYA